MVWVGLVSRFFGLVCGVVVRSYVCCFVVFAVCVLVVLRCMVLCCVVWCVVVC